ncbi:MAG TPA: restriction endonuclease subunit S [Pyrinomonadaceae bacterium]|nr:restriction endonuclease subunit S [Pyrinomonadaceae bacterium]
MTSRWQQKSIGELCDLATGGTPSRSKPEYFEGGTIKWLVSGDIHRKEILDCEGRISEAGLQNSNARYLPINSVMIALNGQGKTRGTVAMLRTKATCNQSLVSIFPKDTKSLLPEYLFHNLRGRYDELRKITGDDGNDRRGLNMPLIRNIRIPVPPIEEQRQIIAILDEAFETIDETKQNTEKNLQNARQLFESHLQSVFTRRGAGWLEKPFEELIESNVIGLTKSSGEQGDRKAYPYVKMNNITRDNRFDFSNFACVDATAAEVNKFRLQKGDFLFNTRNSYELVGKSCIYDLDSDDGVLFNNNIMRVRFKAGVDARFVLLAFSSRPVAEELNSLKSGTTNVSAIYFKDLKSLTIPIPPVSEQRTIAAKTKSIAAETQRLESVYRRKLAALDELKKSLLHRAFSGEL